MTNDEVRSPSTNHAHEHDPLTCLPFTVFLVLSAVIRLRSSVLIITDTKVNGKVQCSNGEIKGNLYYGYAVVQLTGQAELKSEEVRGRRELGVRSRLRLRVRLRERLRLEAEGKVEIEEG